MPKKNLKSYRNPLSRIYGFTDIILIVFLVIDFGYKADYHLFYNKSLTLLTITTALIALNFIRLRISRHSPLNNMYKANLLVLITTVVLTISVFLIGDFDSIHKIREISYIIDSGLIVYFLLRLTHLLRKLYTVYHNPLILFIGSFVVIALIGSFLLMLPNATTGGIRYIDALFTATSAVCVTGLIVMDTATEFTSLGQTIILVIIQLGGIGMLTFTSFFAFFFKGGTSFQEGLNIRDVMGTERLNDVLRVAVQVVIFTFALELVGAVLIFYFISDISDIDNKLFFSLFHSISAFCNAGFSTLSDGLGTAGINKAYAFQWVIMFLIIFGGLGYNIVFNALKYIRQLVLNIIAFHKFREPVRVLTLNSKIVLVTTSILLFVGTLVVYLAESNNMLRGQAGFWGKFTTASFISVTTRTAGFNTVDFADLTIPVILFCILLMWIGASPASTGGGIKTSTFALAVLNIAAMARGKENIEIGTRQINNQSVKRAFAIICISLFVIGIAILLLLVFDPQFTLIQIAFEVFSAYSTVGLSLGITSELSDPGRLVLIFVMFFGRIGLLNLLIGMLRRIQHNFHRYPEENILIN
ncbi:TrkH family potassium uptake protein [Sinomicrobium soli]|uniref:TrkH family potassium uptake protein n=1 Tax=Sinomicrobium sp. N-1-3-6 TaxID=2219864 RepID=UPI000DCC1E91|nr:potassium transporter TrkG [Sinomicrobium sp. N-1-3-6]RAV28338.1 potassium transporter [Sinomicrobium sp. N-1-3-6]